MRRRQRGIVLLMYMVGLLAVIGMAGVALDLGMAYLTKTRLQNALDAAALDGAKTLLGTASTTLAQAAAQNSFTQNVSGATPVITFSDTQSPFTAGGLNPKFVKVAVSSLSVPTSLSKVLGVGNAISISGEAMAGPLPLGGELCGAIPIALCGVNNGDSDCSDGQCFGITGDATGEIEVKTSSTIGPGNYGLVVLSCGDGGACIRTGMAGGEESCFTPGGTVSTKTGVSGGPVAQGINTRFNKYSGGGLSASDYPGDVVTTGSTVAYPLPTVEYTAYQALLTAGPTAWDNDGGVPERRVALAPIIDCSVPINGHQTVSVIGSGCLFLKRQSPTGGPNAGSIYGQLVGSCQADGGVPGVPGAGGPERIVLFQSSVQG